MVLFHVNGYAALPYNNSQTKLYSEDMTVKSVIINGKL